MAGLPNGGDNGGNNNIGDLSSLVSAINSLNELFKPNGEMGRLLRNISDNSITRDDFRNLIRSTSNNSGNNNNNNSGNNRNRNRDYSPRFDFDRDRRYQNEMTQNLETSSRIIQDFRQIISGTNSSLNDLNRILDESNRKINRNLENIGNLDFTRATQNLQRSLDSFIRGTTDGFSSSLMSLRRYQTDLSNSIRGNGTDLIRQTREQFAQLHTQYNLLENRAANLNIENNPLLARRNALQSERNSLEEQLEELRRNLEGIDDITRQIESNRAEQASKIGQRQDIDRLIAQLNERLASHQLSPEEYQAQRNSLDTTRNDIIQELSTLQSQEQSLVDTQTLNAGLRQSIVNEIGSLDTRIHNFDTQIDDVSNLIDRNNNAIENIEQQQQQLNSNAEQQNRYLTERDRLNRQAKEVLQGSLDRTRTMVQDVTESTTVQSDLLDTSRDLRRSSGIVSTDFSNFPDILANALGFKTEEQEEQNLKPFEELIESYNRALADNANTINSLNQQSERLTDKIDAINNQTNGELVIAERDLNASTRRLEQLNQQLTQASTNEDKERIQAQIDSETKAHDNLELQTQNLKAEAKILKAEIDNIEANKEQLTENEKLLNEGKKNAEQMLDSATKNLGLFPQLINKALTGAGNLIKKGISEVEDYIKQAANDVFDSFERLQQSIGKTLKMNSGAYEEFKEQMIAAADEAGLAIDVTQLNEVASSMSELGIRDTELLKDFAVGATILSESGSTLKLNEDTVRQLNASYQANIRNGMSQQEASEALIDNFYEIAAAEKMMVDKYGNTLALSNGGQDIIRQLFDKLSEAGYLPAEDFGKFFTNMSQYLGAMETAGIDSSTLMQDFDAILAGNISGLNTELKAWFQDNPYKTTDDFYHALATDFGSVAKSLVTFQSSLYQNMDEQDISYVGPAFGSNRTNWQLIGIQQRTDTVNELFEDSVSTNDRLESAVSDIKAGLKDGTWLTATDRLNKRAINAVDNIASEFQDLPDGKVIMNEGFAVVTERLNSIIDGIGDILTALITGNLINNPLNPEGGGGGLAGTQLRNFLLGGEGAAGVAGKVVGSVAGVGMMGYSTYQHWDEIQEDKSEGIYNLLTDSTFTAGFGTAIGGAMGGPVGAAVGGVIGSFIPTVENKFENWLTKGLTLDNSEELEAARQLQQAAEDLTNSALDHSNNAKTMTDNLKSQQKAFDTFSDDEKATWLLQHEQFLKEQGIIDEQYSITKEDGKNNDRFQDAINSWTTYMQKEADKETALGEADKFTEDLSLAQNNSGLGITADDIGFVYSDSLKDDVGLGTDKNGELIVDTSGLTLDVDRAEVAERTNKRKSYAQLLYNEAFGNEELGLTGNTDYQAILAEKGITEEDLQKLAETGEGALLAQLDNFAEAYTDVMELMSDKKAIMESGDFDTKLETIKKWATANDDAILDEDGNFVGFKDFEKSVTEYLTATGSFTEEEAKSQAELYASLQDSYSTATDTQSKIRAELIEKIRNYDENSNKTYGEIINEIVAENAKNAESPDYIDYSQYIDTSSEEYNQWANQYQSEDYQTRKNTAESIPLNIGKYATGLEYVPYDDFPALLHRGETVLDPDSAEIYRNLLDSISDKELNGSESIDLSNLSNATTLADEDINSLLDTYIGKTTNLDSMLNTILDAEYTNTNTINNLLNNIPNDISDNNIISNNVKLGLVNSPTTSLEEDYGNILQDLINNNENTTVADTYGSIINKDDLTNIIDTSSITTSVDNQTNVVVDLLTKILNILTVNASTTNRSYLPRSLVQLDSNLNRL